MDMDSQITTTNKVQRYAVALSLAALLLALAASGVAQQRFAQDQVSYLATGGNPLAFAHSVPIQRSPRYDNPNRDVRFNVTPIGVLPGKQNSFLPNSDSINDSRVLSGYCWNFSDIFI